MSNKPTPFCCDITSGSVEEQNEFKRLYTKALHQKFGFIMNYYGISDTGNEVREDDKDDIPRGVPILPLSEGIQILKEMVGEETEPKEDDNLKLALKEAISLLKRTTEYEVMDSWKDDINRLESILQPKP